MAFEIINRHRTSSWNAAQFQAYRRQRSVEEELQQDEDDRAFAKFSAFSRLRSTSFKPRSSSSLSRERIASVVVEEDRPKPGAFSRLRSASFKPRSSSSLPRDGVGLPTKSKTTPVCNLELS